MRKFDNDSGKIFFLGNSCDKCCLRPGRYYTIEDIWHTFGFDWDVSNSNQLPTLKLDILEKLAFGIALKEAQFNQKIAAEKLGVTQRVITWMLKKYNVTSEKYRKNTPKKGELSTEDLFNQGANLFEWANGRIILCEPEED
jgi:hypothetical protein